MDPLTYFAYFKYVPTVAEFLRFSPFKKVPKNYQIIDGRVVTPKTRKYLKQTLKREKLSLEKLEKRAMVLGLLSRLPQIKYLGISGSVSMLNASAVDDIDLFIVTRENCLFTARFLAVLLTSLFGVRRVRNEPQAKDKLCLNLFFSEANLKIPKIKQNLYIAHEILQLFTVVDKQNTYQRFLAANRWIKQYFKNIAIRSPKNTKQPSKLCWGEKCLRLGQLWLINQHRTTEIITATQLWFFPKDFERQLTQLLRKTVAKNQKSL